MTISKKAMLVDNPDLTECVRFKLRGAAAGLSIDGTLSKIVTVLPWHVDFGDGTRSTLDASNTEMPSHVYSADGDYDIVFGGRLTGVSCRNSKTPPLLGSAKHVPCPALREIIFADTAPTAVISASTFHSCATVERVVLPPKLVSLGAYVFYGCTGLTEIDLPESLETITASCFSCCTNLTRIVNRAPEPQEIAASVFSEVPRDIPLYVPADSVEVYKTAAVWKEFEVTAL